MPIKHNINMNIEYQNKLTNLGKILFIVSILNSELKLFSPFYGLQMTT
jgi:hypothetical protein